MKTHWYTGFLYRYFIQYLVKPLHNEIIKLIQPNSSVLDLGCGTGLLAVQLATKCKHVVGIDTSEKMLYYAIKQKNKKCRNNLEFILGDLFKMRYKDDQYNFATVSMMIHEISEEERLKYLCELKRVAKYVIVGDYNPVLPPDFAGNIIRLIEFMAGGKHHRNFKNFILHGGIPPILDEAGLKMMDYRLIPNSGFAVYNLCAINK